MDAETPIRVMIVDDHAVVRCGLKAFLSTYSDFDLVGEAENGLQALRLTGQLGPDVIVMDLLMPEMDGPTAIRLIRQQYPQVQIVALTSFRDDELVQGALQAGAISYLLKNVVADELALAIRAAHRGRSTLSPEAAGALIQAAARPKTPGFVLTGREQDVLGWMVKGLSNGEIAVKLVVSPSTVKFHVSNILAKMNVASRTEAVALALQGHLVAATAAGEGVTLDESAWRPAGAQRSQMHLPVRRRLPDLQHDPLRSRGF